MYAVYGNIYHQYTPNVSIYTIHGSYGIYIIYNVYICRIISPRSRPPQSMSIASLTKVVSSLANRMASCTSTVLNRKLGRWCLKARPQQRKQRSWGKLFEAFWSLKKCGKIMGKWWINLYKTLYIYIYFTGIELIREYFLCYCLGGFHPANLTI